jgi:hypothetical protein
MREFVFWLSVVGMITFGRLLVDFLEARLKKNRCLFGCARRNIIKVSNERGVCCRCGWMRRVGSDRRLNSPR